MFLAALNKPHRLMSVRYIDVVTPDELIRARDNMLALLAEMEPGFRLLADFTLLKSMDIECREEIGAMMERFDRVGVSQVIRVIPDETKDIGMKILTIFHYQNRPNVVPCQSLADA